MRTIVSDNGLPLSRPGDESGVVRRDHDPGQLPQRERAEVRQGVEVPPGPAAAVVTTSAIACSASQRGG